MGKRGEKGQLKKGTVLNPTGRPKGSQNKITVELRESIKNIVDSELKEVKKRLNQLQPKERLDFLVKLLPYVAPKLYDHTSKGNEITAYTHIGLIPADERKARIIELSEKAKKLLEK